MATKTKLWSVAGVALIAAAAVTPMRGELAAMMQSDPEQSYLSCLSDGLAAADPTTTVRRMVPAYQGCATQEVAYRAYLMDQGVRAERIKWLVGRVNETVYSRFVGASADKTLGCFERQMKKADAPVVS